MEHQSCIAYGNQYLNGYLGNRIGESDWGLNFDYIIVHETAHEWFANSISCNDVADLWIHESFTTYAESLFVEYYYGLEAAKEYILGVKPYVRNKLKIQGTRDLNKQGSVDMYYKGSLMLHTLRQVFNSDTKWKQLLKDINTKFYHKTISGQDLEEFIDSKIDLKLHGFF
ncbi:M1 family aminopeptidase, partial [Flavobacteriaceae bacterium]|nr:M1 family aminopeptidase [Flavobacteriaceae bacterium]